MKVTVLQGQSLQDIAVQTCGTAEADFLIAVLNGLSVTDELQAGQVLDVPVAIEKRTAAYYENRNIKPATAVNQSNKDFRIFDNTFDLPFE